MKNIMILENSEMKALHVYDITGIEWTRDCLGNAGVHADEEGIYHLSKDDFKWWEAYIDGENATVADVERIASERNMSPYTLMQSLRIYVGDTCSDMEYERAIATEFLAHL